MTDMGDASHRGKQTLDEIVAESRSTLTRTGEVLLGSGRICRDAWELCIHTDFGPLSQDKDGNQDYALAWSADREDTGCPIRLAAAIADGVTSSYRSEWAAELACWAAALIAV